jgi:hypothetical protein
MHIGDGQQKEAETPGNQDEIQHAMFPPARNRARAEQ